MAAATSGEGDSYQLVRIGHHSKMVEALEAMLHDEVMCDVTIVCEGQSVRAHRVILGASSAYFKEVFRNTPAGFNSSVFLKNFSVDDLNDILGFVYKGEVVVPSHRLGSLLEAAKSLGVSGLTGLNLNQPTDGDGGMVRMSSSGSSNRSSPCPEAARRMRRPKQLSSSSPPPDQQRAEQPTPAMASSSSSDSSETRKPPPSEIRSVTKVKLRSWSQQISRKNLMPRPPDADEQQSLIKINAQERGRPKKMTVPHLSPKPIAKRGRGRPPVQQDVKRPKLQWISPEVNESTGSATRRASSRVRISAAANGELITAAESSLQNGDGVANHH